MAKNVKTGFNPADIPDEPTVSVRTQHTCEGVCNPEMCLHTFVVLLLPTAGLWSYGFVYAHDVVFASSSLRGMRALA